MMFKVQTGQMRDIVGKIVSVVDKKNTRPILTYTKIEIKDQALEISATDLEVSAKIILETSTQDQGEFCVNARNLFDILQVLPEGEVTFNLENESNLNISLNEIHYKLLVYKSDDFPHLSFGNIQNEFSIQSKDILEIINKTNYAVSNDETRLYLNGIYLQDMDGKLRAVATDGHRLALLDTDVLMNSIDTMVNGIIIPKKGVSELKKIAESNIDAELKISVDDSFIYVSSNDQYYLSVRLISREYPKYQAVIPNKTSYTLHVQRTQFLDAVKRIKIMSNEKSNGVRAKLESGQMTISANHPSFGDAIETVPIEYDGSEMEIGFNAKYLIDALGILEDNDVVMELNNELSPVVIRADKMPNYLGIIMPLKL